MRYRRISFRFVLFIVGRYEHIQLREGIFQLLGDLSAFFAFDLGLCADNYQKSLFDSVLMDGISGSDDSFSATSLHGSSDLLGHGKSQSVDDELLRMLLLQLVCVQILKNIHTDVSSEKMLPRAISLIIKMVLLDSGKFHFLPQFCALRRLDDHALLPSILLFPLFGFFGTRETEKTLNAKNPDAHTYKFCLK